MRNATTCFNNGRKKFLFHLVTTTIISTFIFQQLTLFNQNDYLFHNTAMRTKVTSPTNNNNNNTTILMRMTTKNGTSQMNEIGNPVIKEIKTTPNDNDNNDKMVDLVPNHGNDTKCFEWENDDENNNVKVDEWVTHHPTWEVSYQNDTYVCFVNIDTPRTQFLQRIYQNQWYSDCTKVYTGPMWNSGWGATIGNVANGLLKGLGNQRPFQIRLEQRNRQQQPYWIYASLKNNINSACPTKDMFCYFLPLTNCTASTTILKGKNAPGYGHISNNNNDDDSYYTPWKNRQLAHRYWLQQYVTRPQHYLRKQIYDYLQQNMTTTFQTPCIAIHVRRSDVIFDRSPRKYYSMADYLQKIPPQFQQQQQQNNTTNNIFLLTDDANAIDEALEFHPEYHWMFTPKQRYRGSEGGVQNHIPSQNPAVEVLTILAELELVKRCNLFIGSVSGFSDVIHEEMKIKDKTIQRINVEDNKHIIYNMKNAKSEEELNHHIKQLRNNKTLTTQHNN